MIAMPYILVDIVLGYFSLVFFVVTTAALLSRYSSANAIFRRNYAVEDCLRLSGKD
jgi:hypothetical protein